MGWNINEHGCLYDSPLEPGDRAATDAEILAYLGDVIEGVRTQKLTEVKAGYEAALAGAVALGDPTPVRVAVESALLAIEDSEGLNYLTDRLQADYMSLERRTLAADSLEELEDIVVSFNI